MDFSSIYIESDQETIPNDSQSQPSQQNQELLTTTTYKNSIYNNSNYKLSEAPNTGIYIFDNGLFERTLLNINFNKEREVLIKCKTCSFIKTTTFKGFKSLNYV